MEPFHCLRFAMREMRYVGQMQIQIQIWVVDMNYELYGARYHLRLRVLCVYECATTQLAVGPGCRGVPCAEFSELIYFTFSFTPTSVPPACYVLRACVEQRSAPPSTKRPSGALPLRFRCIEHKTSTKREGAWRSTSSYELFPSTAPRSRRGNAAASAASTARAACTRESLTSISANGNSSEMPPPLPPHPPPLLLLLLRCTRTRKRQLRC